MNSSLTSDLRDSTSAARNSKILIVYTAAIFVSALLLFSVQPLFTKMVLPRLGGSPAVWSVAMVFFQSLLLFGYAYAHYLMTVQNRIVPVAVHLALLVVAALTLPLSIAGNWGDPPATGTPFWLLGLFAVSIGLPFFALAANNPMLQAWFVRTGHPDGPDPYFLYASSNIGSFLALLSYPIVFEPVFTLRMQNFLWTGGYVLLIALIAACGFLLVKSPPYVAPAATSRRRRGPLVAVAPALDLPRRRAVGPAGRRHRAHLDRRRRRAAALGAAAVALSSDLGAGVPGPAADPAQICAAAAAAGDRRRDLPAGLRRRAQPAADARRASALLLRHRHGLPRRARAHASRRAVSHRLLRRAVVRRHGRRSLRRPDRAVRVLVDRRVSDPGGACGAVPAEGRGRAAVAGADREVELAAGGGRAARRRRAISRSAASG